MLWSNEFIAQLASAKNRKGNKQKTSVSFFANEQKAFRNADSR
jgi:hypothetical protein